MMVSVKPIMEPLCLAKLNLGMYGYEIGELVGSIALKFPDIALDPITLFEIGGIELPNILLGLDISGTIDIPLEATLPAFDVAIGMLVIPVNLVIGWAAKLPQGEFPSLPTIEFIIDLLVDLGFDPNIDLACVAEIIMIPLEAVMVVAGGDTSICE
jgi:hypothetical protein